MVKDSRFIMPGIIDSHVQLPTGAGFEHTDLDVPARCVSKKECLDHVAETLRNNPGPKRYRFKLTHANLNGDDLTQEDIAGFCREDDELIL